MRLPPVYRGRKINKMMCIAFAIFFAVFLAVGILVHDFGFVLAQIMGAFTLFYGLLWAVWAGREKKAELELREAAEARAAAVDADGFASREYVLPREQLTDAAFERLVSIGKWSVLVALCVFALIAGLLIRNEAFKGFAHALAIMLFCIVIAVPGIIIQCIIYRKYAASVPRKIGLYPGKITVDDSIIATCEINEIRISPDRVYNPHSPGVFREMMIRTSEGEKHYRIDFRAGGPVCWDEYPQFAEALAGWGRENNVPVTVMYME